MHGKCTSCRIFADFGIGLKTEIAESIAWQDIAVWHIARVDYDLIF